MLGRLVGWVWVTHIRLYVNISDRLNDHIKHSIRYVDSSLENPSHPSSNRRLQTHDEVERNHSVRYSDGWLLLCHRNYLVFAHSYLNVAWRDHDAGIRVGVFRTFRQTAVAKRDDGKFESLNVC